MPNITTSQRCTVQVLEPHPGMPRQAPGGFCDKPSMPGVPFPICYRHAAELYGTLRGVVDEWAVGHVDGEIMEAKVFYAQPARQPEPTATDEGIVYYVQVGPAVKIGMTTQSLRARLRDYPPMRIVRAVEPGGRLTENERHRQFAHLRISGEWYSLGLDLERHIVQLRAQQGVHLGDGQL